MKRSLSLIWALVMLIGLLPQMSLIAKAEEIVTAESFTPLLRFAVASDVHIRDTANNDYGSRKQLAEFFRTAYAYSDAQSAYTGLDGMFFLGDNTQNGSATAQTYFFNYIDENLREGTVARAVMGNHEFYATGNYTAESFAQAPLNFMEYSGYDSVDAHLVIKGYHFIFLSMDAYSSGKKFSDKKLEWLEDELAVAAAADETGKKPIFVFQHEPPEGAVGGAVKSASDSKLTNVLAKYPQVVDFSGHTHRAVTDPHSIWQDQFTALTAGSLAYITTPIAGHQKYDDTSVLPTDKNGSWEDLGSESGIRNGGMYYILEVDANSRVRVIIYDIFTDSVYGDPIYLDGIGDPNAFTLTESRANTAVAPEFGEDTSISVTQVKSRRVQVQFPQATCATDPVQNYRLELYIGEELVDTQYYLSCSYYGSGMPKTMNINLTNLIAETSYTLRVYAVSSWGIDSEPIAAVFSTGNDLVMPDILSVKFQEDGSAINTVDGSVLGVYGEPGVAFCEKIKQNVGVFGGDDCYIFNDIDYSILAKEFTLEAYLLVPEAPTSGYMDLVSGQEMGGFGFEYKSDGNVYFYCNVNGSYKKPSCALTAGEYAHLVGTFDGSAVRLYLNGVLMSEVSARGTLTPPAEYAQRLCIGADPYINDTCNHFTTGKIAIANLYSFALTDLEVEVRSGLLHTHSYSATISAPTCTQQGYTTYTCSCGDSYVDDYVDATGHSFANGSCTVCGELKYILLQPELFQGAFWYPTKPGRYNELITDMSDSYQYYATIRFTRETLPVGSIIVLKDGWQYRPDGWITDAVQTGTRAPVTTKSYVEVTEAWWSDYTIRGFNISKVGLPSMMDVSEEEVRAAFQILVPENSHIHNNENGICSLCGEIIGPVITQQPVDGEAKMGERYMVEVKAEGEGLNYQWYYHEADSDQWMISSVTDSVYEGVMTKALVGCEIYCVITDVYGNSVTTQTVELICSTSWLPGDINGDGEVNNKDVTRLFRYLSGYDVDTVEAALDVNGDGEVNNKDLTRLFRYLSGWDVEIY